VNHINHMLANLSLLCDLQEPWLKVVACRLKETHDSMPPKTLLEDPTLLTTPVKQTAFITAMNNSNVGARTAELSGLASIFRSMNAKALNFPKQVDLLNTRQHGKKCCGAHAVLTSVDAASLPEDACMLEGHAIEIETKLKRKGIGLGEGNIPLPPRFQAVLDGLKKAGQEAKAKAQRAEQAK
jgi:hypothetical protein